MLRLAYVATHLIQYQAPLLRRLSESREIFLKAFCLSGVKLRAQHEQAFKQIFRSDVALTEGYQWELR